MRYRHPLAVGGLALGLGLAAAALALAATHGGAAGVARFRETTVSYSGMAGRASETETWRTQVWLLKRTQAVGTGVIACIRVDDNTSIRQCSGTYILPRGRIQVAGEIINRAAFQLAIIGGSGVYDAAGGVMIVQKLGLVTLFLT